MTIPPSATTTASPRGLIPNPLALLHRKPNQPKKPFSPDKVLVKAAMIGVATGSIAAAGYTTHGAFFAKATPEVAEKAIAKLNTFEKSLAIGVSFLFGGALGAVLSTMGTVMWRGIVHQWKPPSEAKLPAKK
jgi:hypothetical protein